MKTFFSLLIILGLTACSLPQQQTAWLTPEMQRTKAKCEYEIALAKIKKAQQPAMMNACMSAQGYQGQSTTPVSTSSGSGLGSSLIKSVINGVIAQ